MSKRLRVISIIAVFCVFVDACFIFFNTGLIRGINPSADKRKEEIKRIIKIEENLQSTFKDRNGVVLSEQDPETREVKNYFDPAFSYLIGYNSRINGAYGLKDTLDEYLYENKDGEPSEICLTIDSNLQYKSYNILRENNMTGSIVVLNNKTGEILADVSRTKEDFSLNNFSSKLNFYNSIPGFFMKNSTTVMDYPASAFKIVGAAAIIEEGLEDTVFNDVGYVVLNDGQKIHNNNNLIKGEVDLQGALSSSLNTYFAHMIRSEIGREKFTDICQRFQLGKRIELEYASLNSELDLNSDANLTMSAYGQVGVRITPMHLAMICSTIANDGDMIKPYVVQSISLKGKSKHKGKRTYVEKNIIKGSVAEKLCDYLQNVAVYTYGLTQGDREFVCAKTGTAQVQNSDNGMNNSTYFCYFDNEYTIVINRRDFQGGYGKQLQEHVEDIILELEKMP